MLKRSSYLVFLLSFFAMTAIAQPGGEAPIVEGDDGAKEAADRAKYLIDFHNYNAELNNQLGTKNMFRHHMDINMTNASIPKIGVVTQSVDFYFALKNGEYVIKKVLVLTKAGTVSSSKEFVFDHRGDSELSYYSYNSDINKSDGERNSFYYDGKQLAYYAEDGLVQPKNGYGDDIFKKGIEVLNAAEDYRLVLNTILRIQPK